MAELVWHVDGTDDLDAVATFIARDAPVSASLFVARILDAVARLKEYPQLGRLVPEIGEPSYRELVFQNYRIVYRLLDDRVVILGIVHAAMDMESQARGRGWDIT